MKKRTNSLIVSIALLGWISTVSAASIHYSFDEIASGTWEVNVTVAGDTAGLSCYTIWVNNSTGVSYVENTLGTLSDGFTPIGFLSSTMLSGDIQGRFDASNYQQYGDVAITGIGITPVYAEAPAGIPIPPVDLGVPALMGTLTTPAGLGEADFEPQGGWLLNADNTYYYQGDVTITHEVNPIPEPATMGLLVIGGLGMIRRRK